MANAIDIVINDGQSTPVAHTLTVSKTSDSQAVYYGPGLTLIGREQLVITRREPTATVAGKVNFKLTQPIEKTVNGVTTVDFQDLASLDFVMAPRSEKQHRKNLRVLMKNLLDNATVAQVVDDMVGLT